MDLSPENLGLAPDISLLPIEVQDLIRHGNRGQYPTHSEAAAAVCAAMFRVNFGVAELWMVMTDPINGISAAFFEKDGEQAEAYLELTISQAHDLTARKELST